MANYLKATDFAAKDALLSGDPNKIVKGTEIDDEFDAIQTAVNSKANIASPALTGTPTAPTAAFGSDTTQLATTAFVQAALIAVLDDVYPVGSIYTSVSATLPAAISSIGTWVAFGAGKVLVGQDAGDASFDTLEETGGSKNAVVVSHTHTITDPGHQHDLTNNQALAEVGGGRTAQGAVGSNGRDGFTIAEPNTTGITIDSAGVSGTNANLQPYVVVKMWKRTA